MNRRKDPWPGGDAGVLLDVDGTLLSGDEPLPGARELVARLDEMGRPYRLVTNTTRRSRRSVAEALASAGFRVPPERIVTPAALARQRILGSGRPRAALLVAPEVLEDLEGVSPDSERPDWVVVGDLGPGFTWERLNEAFHRLLGGAGLLALQKNRFWHAGPGRGLVLDAGPFVAALEYAAGVRAEVLGKPEPAFFRLALESLGMEPAKVWMVGDDPVNDAWGGGRAGCRTVLVRSGKFREADLRERQVSPDRIVDSLEELL